MSEADPTKIRSRSKLLPALFRKKITRIFVTLLRSLHLVLVGSPLPRTEERTGGREAGEMDPPWNYNFIQKSKGGSMEIPPPPETTTGEWNERFI